MTSPSQNKEVSASLRLMRATSDGDLTSVTELLAAGADVNFANPAGQTVLILAAVLGHEKIAARLLEAGADPNLRDRLGLTALEWSKRRGFSEITQLITKFSAATTPPAPAETSLASAKGNSETESIITPDLPSALRPDSQHPFPTSTIHTSEEFFDDREIGAHQPELIEASMSSVDATEKLAVADDDVSYPSALDSEPKSQPTTEPILNVSPAVANTTSTPESQDLNIGPPSAIVHPAPAENVSEIEEADTLTRPNATVTGEDDTPIRSEAAVASSGTETVATQPVPMFATAEREPAFRASPLGLSATQAGENLKYCPKCHAVYENTSQLYCTRDRTGLVGQDVPLVPVAAPETSTPIAVWLLIAFVLGASAFGAYRLTQYLFRTEAPLPIAASPVQPPSAEVKEPFFSVGGALAGAEMNIPEPDFPADAQAAGVAGPITVKLRVNKNGRVISAVTTSGDRRLRAAAVKAARQATFAPDKLAAANPRSGVVAGNITYRFALPEPATSPTPTATENTVSDNTSTAASNTDRNAPVVSAELMSAAVNVPNAEYPARMRPGIEGTITVTVRVNRSGKVISWRSSSGDSKLRAAAIKAARKATFSPERLPGKDVLGTITYNFTP